MKLIIGLGNIGEKYNNTRHNVGFMLIDKWIANKNVTKTNRFDSTCYEINLLNEKIILLKPNTYMNLSGNALIKAKNFYKIDLKDILVINDDLDLELGKFKLKKSGSSGGHNGLLDIERVLNTKDYFRLKVGISKNPDIDKASYVLSKFTNEENEILDNLMIKLCYVIDDFITCPFNELQNKYN